jgi:hypothetical protein
MSPMPSVRFRLMPFTLAAALVLMTVPAFAATASPEHGSAAKKAGPASDAATQAPVPAAGQHNDQSKSAAVLPAAPGPPTSLPAGALGAPAGVVPAVALARALKNGVALGLRNASPAQ